MKTLVKIGGTLLDAPESRRRIASEITGIALASRVVVVHGGGKQMTRYLGGLGSESRFVNGLRVTTDEVLDAVLKVLAGTVNHELVSAFVGAGSRAVGLSGIDDSIVECERISAELGHVGRPLRCKPELLDLLVGGGFVPVVACIGGDTAGRMYNVNADSMAVACAVGFRANRIVFLTDVEGVRGADGTTLEQITVSGCRQLIESGVATGGMQAKLTAAMNAIEGGVNNVFIAPGFTPGTVKRILAGETVGTRVIGG